MRWHETCGTVGRRIRAPLQDLDDQSRPTTLVVVVSVVAVVVVPCRRKRPISFIFSPTASEWSYRLRRGLRIATGCDGFRRSGSMGRNCPLRRGRRVRSRGFLGPAARRLLRDLGRHLRLRCRCRLILHKRRRNNRERPVLVHHDLRDRFRDPRGIHAILVRENFKHVAPGDIRDGDREIGVAGRGRDGFGDDIADQLAGEEAALGFVGEREFGAGSERDVGGFVVFAVLVD